MPPPVERLAARQWGVFALWQLRGGALTPSGIRKRCARGKLHRVHRGVYALSPVLTREGRMMAAVLACGPGALLSHRSAAALWDLRPAARTTFDVSVMRAGAHSRDRIDVHRVRSLEPARRHGIPITTVARTIVDCAEVLDARGVERMVERAVMLGLFDLRRLERATEGRRGAPVLTSLLAQYNGQTKTRSNAEELFLRLVRERPEIPDPQVNVHVAGHERDFVWPRHRLIVETDARSTHDTPGAWERDRIRDQAATATGWTVVRFTKRQLEEEPGYVAAYTSSIVNASSPTSRNFV